MRIFSLSFALFILMDPIGNIPIFIAVLKGVDPKKQTRIIFRELIIALFVMVFFYYIGDYLLSILNISHGAVMMSGGIILFIIALKLIFPSMNGERKVLHDKAPFIVPLAIPLVAGPAVLAAIMLYSKQGVSSVIVLSSILIAWVFTTAILLSSSFLKNVLGKRGILACEKLMGLVLIMIAIQMFVDGLNNCCLLPHQVIK
ncbi:MAG TPA: MarC family protein [Rhabdochlamydiaceae bacterium]|nr:MarC family protein [Rhabdochlamydiaceae bacterium]